MTESLMQQNFRKDAPFAVTYDYTDFVRGAGINKFYGFCNSNNGADTYLLIEDTISAGYYDVGNPNVRPEDTGAATAIVATTTVNYDTLVFNLPKTINGVCFVSIPVAYSVLSGSGTNSEGYVKDIKLILIHADASTANLTTVMQTNPDGATATGPVLRNVCFTLALPSIANQLIKIGEKLRLTVSYVVTAGDMFALHNAAGSSITFDGGTAPHTQLVFSVPFKINE